MKAAGWNPELSMKYKTYRAVGRPKKRWEYEIKNFLRPERTEDEMNNVERNVMNGSRQRKIKKVAKGCVIGMATTITMATTMVMHAC